MVSVVVLVAVVVTTVVAVVVVAAAVVTRKRKSVLIANTLVGIIMRQGSTPRTYSSKHAQIQERATGSSSLWTPRCKRFRFGLRVQAAWGTAARDIPRD